MPTVDVLVPTELREDRATITDIGGTSEGAQFTVGTSNVVGTRDSGVSQGPIDHALVIGTAMDAPDVACRVPPIIRNHSGKRLPTGRLE